MKTVNPSELELKDEKVIKINRVSKATTGGRRFQFNAIVVVGDGKGHVGIGSGKAKEVTGAINKAREDAKKNIVRVSIINGTIPYPIIAKFGAGKVMLKPASPGTGIIAGGPIRAIMEQVGITDILSKSMGSPNAHNIVKATMVGLQSLEDAYQVSSRRDISVKEVFN